MRAFIAVEITPATIDKISTALEPLKSRLNGLRWVAPSNIHLTLKFLGNIDEKKIDAIGEALADTLHPFRRFTINAKGVGVFPSIKKPRVLWVGLDGNELTALAAAVDSALAPFGFPREEKHFTPHLTVGRWRQTERTDAEIEPELRNWRHYEFGATLVNEVILFGSVLKPGGAVYNRLNVVTLQN